MFDYLSPLQAIHENGTVVLFDGVRDLQCHIYWLSRQGGIGEHHSVSAPDGNGALVPVPHATWVLRDDAGRPIDPRALERSDRETGYRTRMRDRQTEANAAAARGLPIPHTGRRRYGSYMRLPQTCQEIRANAALWCDRDDLPVPVEQIRTRKNLPTAWDDIMRHREKGWKRHRRHQWRGGWPDVLVVG